MAGRLLLIPELAAFLDASTAALQKSFQAIISGFVALLNELSKAISSGCVRLAPATTKQ